MKNLITLALVMVSITLVAQSPESINFQAVARDNSGNLIINQPVSFRMSLLQGSPSGTVVYSEMHNVTTNDYGLATLAIGAGTVISGDLSLIDWGTSTYYLKTELDPAGGSSYQVMGTSQFLSVPYELYAKTAGSGGGGGSGWSLSGNSGTNPSTNFLGTTDPLNKLHVVATSYP
ncbi:MAG: hypothetical protein FJY10_05960 [Bacteroidetes bacterium]|nr:hypothetical protein [Bacteroidota bacterium]